MTERSQVGKDRGQNFLAEGQPSAKAQGGNGLVLKRARAAGVASQEESHRDGGQGMEGFRSR